MSASLKPDPSIIGGVAKVPLARLPDPEAVFATRAERFAFLAGYNPNLAPYLEFLAAISRVQAGLVRDLPHAHLGHARTVGQPVHFNGEKPIAMRSAPTLDADRAAILNRLNLGGCDV